MPYLEIKGYSLFQNITILNASYYLNTKVDFLACMQYYLLCNKQEMQ